MALPWLERLGKERQGLYAWLRPMMSAWARKSRCSSIYETLLVQEKQDYLTGRVSSPRTLGRLLGTEGVGIESPLEESR